MPLDVVHVEVAWDTDPLTRPADVDWTRLGTVDPKIGVESLTTSRGVNIRTGDIETGEATARLSDVNGNLDPSNVLSEWAPNVLPRRRVRFVIDPGADPLTWDGDPLFWDADPLFWDAVGETVLWTGFVNRLPIQWRRELQWTTLSAAGIFWLLAEVALPPSVLHAEVVGSGPVGYWPLTESAGSVADDVVGNLDGVYKRPVDKSGALVPWDQRDCVEFATVGTADPVGQSVRIAPWTPTSEMSFAVWWRSPVPDSPANLENATPIPVFTLSAGPIDATTGVIQMRVHPAQEGSSNGESVGVAESFGLYATPGAAGVAFPDHALFDNAPHLLGFTLTDADVWELFIDGIEYASIDAESWDPLSTTDFGTLIPTMTHLYWGWGIAAGYSHPAMTTPAVMGHGAAWDRVLTGDEWAALYEAGIEAWGGDLTGARLNRILDYAGVDTDDRDIDTGTQTCGPTTLDGGNVMDYVRKIAATEGGPAGETADGKIFLRDRIGNAPAAVAIFTDDPDGDNGSAVAPLDPDYSLDRVINIARVTRETGATQEDTDASSVTTYGPRTVQLDTLHQSAAGARATAARLTIRNHNPRLVFPKVVADAIDTPAAVQIDTDIGDATTVIARPPRGGDPINQTSIVERVEHSLSGRESWKTTFGVAEHTTLPEFWWDEPGQGWDESVWAS